MTKLAHESAGGIRLSIAIKLVILLATFGVLAIGLTSYYTYHATREILVNKASDDIMQSTRIMGRRFSIAADDVAKDVLMFAESPNTHEAVGTGHAVEIARQKLAEQFRNLLVVNPEYYQVRFISAQNNGIELVRLDRDGNSFKIVSGLDLQEKLHYPYVYETLRLKAGEVHYSRIFLNREIGAHSGLNTPTLQVASPVVGREGKVLGVIVINVDLKQIFTSLKADLRGEYQLYLANQAGDYLIHPDSAMTFGFDFGRRFLVQDTFKPVAAIVDKGVETVAVRTISANQAGEVVGGFARIPFGNPSRQSFIIIGMTVPLDVVLAETSALIRDSSRIVIGFSLAVILVSIFVAFIFIRPLKRLVVAVQRFSETRELTPVPSQRTDELGLLARSIGQMQEHILAHLGNLNKQNELLQQEIRERERSQQRFRDVSDAAGEYLWELDTNMVYTYVSNRSVDVKGYTPEELVGHTPMEFMYEEDIPQVRNIVNHAFANDAPFRLQHRDRTKSGEVVWEEVSGVPFYDENRKLIGLRGTGMDITERKKAEFEIHEAMRKLEEKELAKTRFLAAAGHDLRQPLAAANLFIDALKNTAPTPKQDEIIQRLDQAMISFNGLLDALLNVSRLDAGVIRPEYASIEVTEILDWLEQGFAPLADEKHLGFKLYCPGGQERLVINSDFGLVKSVLMNLVSNAIKYTSKGGVLVSVRRRGTDALFQVWDTGMGISEEHAKRIFDEFYQIDNPRRDRSRGLGLGLSIAKRALSLLGQEIGCRSQIGRGTVFEFRLPLAANPGSAKQPATGLAPRENAANCSFAQGKRFVVVEDDVLVAQAMVSLLEGMCGEVKLFHSAEDALRDDDINHADYFISDYMLGGSLNGIQFLNQLRKKLGRPIKAVLMTGDTSPSLYAELADCNWTMLSKPIKLTELLSVLRAQGA